MKIIFCVFLLSIIGVDGFYNNIISNNYRDEVLDQPVYSRNPFWLQGSVPQRVRGNQVDLGLSDINSESNENDLDYYINGDSGKVYITKSEEAEKILHNEDHHTSKVFRILNDVLRNAKPPNFKFDDYIELSDANQTVYVENSAAKSNENSHLSAITEQEPSAVTSISPKNYTDNSVAVDSPLDIDYEYQSISDEQRDEKPRINNSLGASIVDSSEDNVDVPLEADIYDQQSDDLIAMENSWDASNYVLTLPEDTKPPSPYDASYVSTFSLDNNTDIDFGDVIILNNDSASNDSSSANFELNNSLADAYQQNFSEINRNLQLPVPDITEEKREDDTVERPEDIITTNRNQRPTDGEFFVFTETSDASKIDNRSSVNVPPKDFHSTQTLSGADSNKSSPSSQSIDVLLISPDELLNYMEDTDDEESTGDAAYPTLESASTGAIWEDTPTKIFPTEKMPAVTESHDIDKNRNEIDTISSTVISIPELYDSPGNSNANYFKTDFVDGWILNNSESQNNAIPDAGTQKKQIIVRVNQNKAEPQKEEKLSETPQSEELYKTKSSMINVQNRQTPADKPKDSNTIQQTLNTTPVTQEEWFDKIPKNNEDELVKLGDAIVSTLRGSEKESSVYKRVLELPVEDVLLDKALKLGSNGLSIKEGKKSQIQTTANKTSLDNSSSNLMSGTDIKDYAFAITNISNPKYEDNVSTLLNDNLKLQSNNTKAVAENKQNNDDHRIENSKTSWTEAKPSNYIDSSMLYAAQPTIPEKAINQLKNVSTDIFFREWNAEEINILSANSDVDLPENLKTSNPNINQNFYLPFDILNEDEEAIDIFNPKQEAQSVKTPQERKVMDRSRSDIPIEEDDDYMDQDYDI